ncbi:expressed unknown protein [Seminavis robusta]|uniref:Uncharacterized protein n=1 Tax=Seminavis robusta TaxID=568900 RepID=A0A9N8HKX2_9STRA|nr:expressed unknown protein [Seminavis robusta]|eukprot:Sro870_g213700.1 n/a (454) ;mRNA; r:33145-34886
MDTAATKRSFDAVDNVEVKDEFEAPKDDTPSPRKKRRGDASSTEDEDSPPDSPREERKSETDQEDEQDGNVDTTSNGEDDEGDEDEQDQTESNEEQSQQNPFMGNNGAQQLLQQQQQNMMSSNMMNNMNNMAMNPAMYNGNPNMMQMMMMGGAGGPFAGYGTPAPNFMGPPGPYFPNAAAAGGYPMPMMGMQWANQFGPAAMGMNMNMNMPPGMQQFPMGNMGYPMNNNPMGAPFAGLPNGQQQQQQQNNNRTNSSSDQGRGNNTRRNNNNNNNTTSNDSSPQHKASSAQSNQDSNNKEANNGLLTGRSPTLLYMTCDDDSLSAFQCMVRRQIELFEARTEDVESNAQGRNKPIVLGQVGIRCRHCTSLPPRHRARASVYYPAKLLGLYQAAQNMATIHLCQHCQRIPASFRTELWALRERKSSAGGGKKYWADGAKVLGVYEADDGLRFENR